MKLVKLNRTHRLFRYGCTYAWRFEGFRQEAMRLENFLTRKYGHQFGKGEKKWRAGYGANERYTIKIEGYDSEIKQSRAIYWIGIKDPADLTFLLLQINDLQAS